MENLQNLGFCEKIKCFVFLKQIVTLLYQISLIEFWLDDLFQQAIDWICDYGEAYLDSHKTVGGSQQETETLLKEHYEFRTRAKV